MSSPGSPRGCADALSRTAAVRSSASRRTRSSSNASRTRPTSASGSERGRWIAQSASGRIGRRSEASSDGGQVLSDIADALECLRVQVAELLLRHVFGGGVDGSEVACLGLAVEVVRGDRETVPVRAAADANARAGDELRLEPRLVEPGRLDLPGLVGDTCSEDRQATATATRRRADDALDDRLLVAEQVTDPPRRHWLLVPARPLPQKISHRRQTEARETACDRRAYAVERLDRGVERLGPRRGARARPDVRCVESGEAGRQRRASDRPIHSGGSL